VRWFLLRATLAVVADVDWTRSVSALPPPLVGFRVQVGQGRGEG